MASPYANKAPRSSSSSDQDWKASGFLNSYLPAQEDSLYKLGFIGLKDAVENQKMLREYLEANPANLAIFAAKVTVDYQSPRRNQKSQIKMISPVPAVATEANTSGYLNFHLPAEGGGTAKLGFIELKADNTQHAGLMHYLEADPKNIVEFLTNLTWDYRPGKKAARPKFSLA